ncbi:MAG: DUF3168 domain-containing protein [Hyphomicrobiaceae bacterium]|nr:MAG: DUF3168 domain-containing protein [Hyphomicrobiaceae bacterium]
MADTASWSLQKAIFAALSSDGLLVGLLGGARIYDDVPQKAALPYITFGQTSARDWSTGTEAGEEHTLSLHVWSEAAGRREVHAILGELKRTMAVTPLALAGYRLVNLTLEFPEARREADGETYHGLARYRAVTETV